MIEANDGRRCEFCGQRTMSVVNTSKMQRYLKCSQCFGEVQANLDNDSTFTSAFSAAQSHYYEENSIYCSPLVRYLGAGSALAGIRTLRKYVSHGRLLEVGPGAGQFLRLATSHGYQCEGVEASPALAKALATRNIPVHVGALEDLDLPNEEYDAYLSFHVIEHVPDPVEHLRKAARLVRPGGIALLATPNTRSAQHRLLGGHSPAYSSAHLRLFSPRSMTCLLKNSGWCPIHVTSRDPGHEWIRVLTSLVRIITSGKAGSDEGAYARATPPTLGIKVLRAVDIVSWPVRRAQEALGTGAELIAVARRE